MSLPKTASHDEWQAAREELLVKEKEATRTRDALAAERRRLPMVPVEKDYVFEGPDGEAGLVDLFDGRRQLVVYRFFGLNVFIRDGERVFRTYFTTGRSAEAIGPVWSFLDLTPLGRQEEWEDSPEGYPQDPPYSWWRLHDEYEREQQR